MTKKQSSYKMANLPDNYDFIEIKLNIIIYFISNFTN